MSVLFHRLAAREFVMARRWYAVRSSQAEARFVAAVTDALGVIDGNPLLGSPYRGNYRWQRLRRFPFVIYFEPVAAGVYVYAVAHARRRPGYWLPRVNRP
jgi:hypothetical protein